MIANRHRGLVHVHNITALCAVSALFWIYAEVTITFLSGWMKLTRDVNLVPYLLSVVIGMLAGSSRAARIGSRLPNITGVMAAGLAASQVALVALVVFSMMFATQDRSISRLFLGTFLVWTWALLLWLHLYVPRWLGRTLFGGGSKVPTLFLGRTSALPRFQEWLEQRRQVGISPVGFLSFDTDSPGSLPPATYLGSVDELPELIERFQVGQVVLLELPPDVQRSKMILHVCQERGCRLLIHHDMDERLEHPLALIEEDGHQFLTLHDEPLEEPLNRWLKRGYDIAVSLPVVLFLLPPLCVWVKLMQQIQSPGPLFYVRPRSGEGRTPFPMVKFRTMQTAGAADEQAEARQASVDDERVFAFGHFLRRHSLDEFPQFWNVLCGQMSIVGPRPVMPLLDDEFERQVRSYRSKHWVKPGITGLAQSRGFRGEIKNGDQLRDRIRLDLHYIAHWSIWLDVLITLRTFGQVFFPPKSAY